MYGHFDTLDISDCPMCGVRVCVLISGASSSSPTIRIYCGEGCQGEASAFDDLALGTLIDGPHITGVLAKLGAMQL